MRRLLLLALVAVLGLAGVVATVPAYAQTPKAAVCEGVGYVGGGGTDCGEISGQPTVTSTIGLVVNLISLVVGVIAVIMVIIGGLKYITSAGESQKISSAKDTILYALIGIAVAALAQVLVRFVVRKATGG